MHKRDFLKILAGSIGGAILSSCTTGGLDGPGGPSGPGEVPDLPSGYRFYRIKTTGETAPSGSAIDMFYGTAHIADNGTVTYTSRDAGLRAGIHQITVDFSEGTPK